MGINRGSANIRMSQEPLIRTHVIALFKQMRGKRMPQGMIGRSFAQARLFNGMFESFLDNGLT